MDKEFCDFKSIQINNAVNTKKTYKAEKSKISIFK